MRVRVVGYGSLLCAEGWNRTLARRVRQEDLEEVEVEGFVRTWSAGSLVRFEGEKSPSVAIFLDLTPAEGKAVNGYALALDDEEFERIRKREKGYEMVDVTSRVRPAVPGSRYFVAVVPPERKRRPPCGKCFVPVAYYDFVQKCLEKLPAAFVRRYRETTEEPGFARKSGEYRFVDEEINLHTGRSPRS